MQSINRRQFLKQLSNYSASLAGGSSLLPWINALASHSPTVPRTIVNTMLAGGADMRYVFAPDPATHDPVYVSQYWAARQNLYPFYTDYSSMFAAQYTLVTDPVSGTFFGIHNSCAWLASKFAGGDAAIVNNTFGSLNRSHDHSQIIVETGDPNAERNVLDREGWAGRLVEAISGAPNVVELSSNVALFCNGSDPGYRLAQVVHAQNTRDMGLPHIDSPSSSSSDSALIRALTAYYAARGPETLSEKPAGWPYRKFFEHHDSIRNFGDNMEALLSTHPLPAGLQSPLFDLNSSSFERQCRNLYDCCLTPHILNYRVISMSYGGWDTHTTQQPRITGNLQDILGAGGGFDTVTSQLDLLVPGATDNLVFTFPWDFGRQLAGNGSNGTDHGRGGHYILIGKNTLNGGVYGDMFPQNEAIPDPGDSQGRTPFEIPGRDIKGLTSLERVFAEMSNWLQAGTGNTVFPGAAGSDLEAGVVLGNVFV